MTASQRAGPALASLRPASARELKRIAETEVLRVPFLRYRDGTGGLQVFPLNGPDSLTAGRGPAVDLRLDWDRRVSALHFELRPVGGQWTILDEGLSSNGTFLNGAPLSGHQRLRDGDLIRAGATTLAFSDVVVDDEPPATTIGATQSPGAAFVTEAQRRVLVALCRPLRQADGSGAMPATNERIAAELFITVGGVKTHLRSLYQRFGLEHLAQNEKRARLAELALERGLVSPRDL
ncbi:MAG TPA: FHA domain-containing protein [Solirubrobacteraceae bacterium]|nr:FHA domain-containing protein [Solirubrobacteraceae bacterium]